MVIDDAGFDAIVAGGGDIVTAGDGADTVYVADWTPENAAEMLDFDLSEDVEGISV